MRYSRFTLVLLAAVCIGAFLFRAEGIFWPKFHPDESVIGAWLEQTAHSAYVRDRVYPNGYFSIARPFMLAGIAIMAMGERFDYVCGRVDRIRGVKPDGIFFGRWFNVWAGTFACVLVFLLAARVTRSGAAGLVAAGLFGFARYAVEHSHYAESDIAAVLVLSAALWLWTVFHDTLRMRHFAAAAFVSGFAAGTKFTLAALLLLVLVEALMSGRWKRSAQCALAGAACFAGGFVLANPAVVLDWHWFWSGMFSEKQRVFAETILNLGPLGAQPGVRAFHHLWAFCGHAMTLGWPWLALAAAGLPCAVLAAGMRRHWPALIVFPVLFAGYWFVMAPWVRSQEFLLFLPSFAALAALPLAVLWRAGRASGRVLAVMLALAALVLNGSEGRRTAALFGWKDTRLQAREWLQVHLPLGSRLAAESYAEASCPPTLAPPLGIRKVERDGLAPLRSYGADYLLRAASVSGRGNHHPITRELLPGAAANLEQLFSSGTLLCAWAPLAQGTLATFVSPVIELHGLRHFEPELLLRAALSCPALIVNADQNNVGRVTFGPVGPGLGCDRALLVDRLPQTIAIGGPARPGRPVYLVLTTAERSAVINVRGFGQRQKMSLAPYDAGLVRLERPERRLADMPYDTITLSADPVENMLYIPCYARVVFTAEEAVRIFLDNARADKIAQYFSEEDLARDLGPVMRPLAALRQDARKFSGPDAAGLAAARRRVEAVLEAEPDAVAVNGISGYYYNQFARACLLPAGVHPAKEQRDGMQVQTMPLPFLAARGSYTLRGEVRLQWAEGPATSSVPVSFNISGMRAADRSLALRPGQWHDFSVEIKPGREVQPCLEWHSPVAVQYVVRNLELEWNLAGALDALRGELAAPSPLPPAIEQALQKRRALALFNPWMALVDFTFDPGSREVRCVLEALRDDTPKLAVSFWLKRRGEWRRKDARPVGAKQWMNQREREVVIYRLGEAFGDQPDASRLGLGLETDVMWHAGKVAEAGGGYAVPFSDILARRAGH